MALGAAVSHAADLFGDPAGMLYALLAPFSARFSRLYAERRDALFYDTVRGDLQPTRASLLHQHDHEDALRVEIREAASGMQNHALRRIFDEFSVRRDEDGCRGIREFWGEPQFTAFVASRLGDAGAAPALWRHFCHDSADLFAGVSFPLQFQRRSDFDFDDWIWTVSKVTWENSACNRELEQPRENRTVSKNEQRKSNAWSTFSRLALPSGNDEKPGDGVWLPPTLLDVVTQIVYFRLREKLWPRRPRLSTVRANVLARNLVDQGAGQQLFTSAFVIPYHDLLHTLCAVLQVRKELDPSVDYFGHRWPRTHVDADIDRPAQLSMAKGILALGGIHRDAPDSPIAFEDYAAFSENFIDSRPYGWSFELALTGLWRALFSDRPQAGAFDKQLPTLVARAFDFMYPFRVNGPDDQTSRTAKLVYALEDVSGASVEGVVRALNSECSGDMVLMYGTTEAASQHVARRTRSGETGSPENLAGSESAILAAMALSPLWDEEESTVDDAVEDDRHLFFELAPRPRILAWSPATGNSKRATYAEHVHVNATSRAASISFGQSAAGSSGLTLNSDTGVATLRSAPGNAGGQQQGYTDIRVGPHPEHFSGQVKQEPRETVVRVQRVEVYSCTGGVSRSSNDSGI